MCRKDFRQSLKSSKDSVFLKHRGREFHDFTILKKEENFKTLVLAYLILN